jgi:hypothetical protein
MQSEWKKVELFSKFLHVKLYERDLFGRPRRRYEDNIRINLKEICINTEN